MKTSKFTFRECCFRTLPQDGYKLVWEITHKCQTNCSYCFQARKRVENRIRVLGPNDLMTVLDKLPVLKVKDVVITGGEIYWAKDVLPEISAKLKEIGISYTFSTNSIHDKSFIDFLIELEPRAINISFDPQLGNEKDPAYSRVVDNVISLVSKCESKGIDVKATAVISTETLPNLNKYIDILKDRLLHQSALTSIYIQYPYDIGYNKTGIRPSENQIRLSFRQLNIDEILIKKLKFINFHRFNAPLQTCPAGNNIIHLEPNGNVYPCHLFANLPKETFLLGNIVHDSARVINERLVSFANDTRDAIAEYKKDTANCIDCKHLEECGGGCLAELISFGRLVEPQLICKYIKPIHSEPPYEPPKQPSLDFSRKEDITEEEEKSITDFIKQNLRKGHDLAHGYDHVMCVVNYAKYLAKKEGANLRIVTPAAYFHDFEPRRKLIYESHTKYSAEKAVTFLRSIGFSEGELADIFHCIETSSYGAHELGHSPITIEAMCVRDADWLDAIGTRGIARVFAFGSAHGCPELGTVEWDIDNPPHKKMSLIGPDPSPIYHFFSKLLWVKSGMCTKTGKHLAEIKHQRMVQFLKEYKDEMEHFQS